MGEPVLRLLLDQNIPYPVADWLRAFDTRLQVWHVNDVGLKGRPDEDVFSWAQVQQAIVVTFDEDFADTRSLASRPHSGIVRLRVWPTTVEVTQDAIGRLLKLIPFADLPNSLVVVDPGKIRLRRGSQ